MGRRPLRPYLAAAMIALSLAVLELARGGVQISRFDIAQTPVTRYAVDGADGPVVVMAHGFAGSQQMMQGYALPLAQAGYRVFVFEFFGHGRHARPMSGDVSSVDGTTRLLVDQTRAVIDAVVPAGETAALLGHSMATDILVRAGEGRGDVGPVVLISAFSQRIDAQSPATLLLVSGAWEGRLRAFARDSLPRIDPTAQEGETVQNGPVSRRAVAAPLSEHVSVLHSRVARAEALAWIDRAYGRTSDIAILPTGWAILGLLGGVVLIFRPLCALLALPATGPMQGHVTGHVRGHVRGRRGVLLVLVPAMLAPLCAVPVRVDVLPVLVADYLVLHLFFHGALQLALMRYWKVPFGGLSWRSLGLLLAVCAVFGVGLDRYAANFWPTPDRFWIIAAMLIGAVPHMLADAVLTRGQSRIGRFLVRAGFLASLGFAVALDFERLFFLMLIAPVLVLFYLVFGTMGRQAALRAGPVASGLALGLVLAWALGVSFPLFQS